MFKIVNHLFFKIQVLLVFKVLSEFSELLDPYQGSHDDDYELYFLCN